LSIFLFINTSRAYPASYPMETGVGRGFISEVKLLEREAYHLPPPSAEIKKASSFNSTP